MNRREYFLGVDGGGTKTEFVCIDADGAVIARAVTGTTYHLEVGVDAAVSRLEQGITVVCAQLAILPNALRFVFFGLPAYGEDNVVDPQLHAACGQLLGHERYACGNDMVCGWAGSLACQDGINIVAGTGSIGYGERQGKAARIGGWGEVIGDEGSAYWIAIQGLALFSRMSDGRAPKAALYHRIFVALSLDSDLDLCRRIMGGSGMDRSEIAALANLVSAAATDGDMEAQAILLTAARELASLAIGLRGVLGFPIDERAMVSWSGGVLSKEPFVRDVFERILVDTDLFDLVEPRYAPGYGAALYTRKLATVPGFKYLSKAQNSGTD